MVARSRHPPRRPPSVLAFPLADARRIDSREDSIGMRAFLDDDVVDLGGHAPLRTALREFMQTWLGEREQDGWVGSWEGFDREFSLALGARGWLGMTMPRRYGGQERSVLERYVVMEELLALGAPVSCHWVADRQIAPLLMRFGSDAQRESFIPRICRGELCFAIGMSEPDSGSDLASVRTRASRVDGGWRIDGRKIWSSNAHRADYMIAVVRTAPPGADRHAGLTQFLLDLGAPGIHISPIRNLAGDEHFSEVVFDGVLVDDEQIVGTLGGGWQQVVSELAFERSGPDRFLSTFRLLVELLRVLGERPGEHAATVIGTLVARLWAIRRMSLQVAGLLHRGEMPNTEAALVKDLGTLLEQDMPEAARLLAGEAPGRLGNDLFEALLDYDILHTPSFSIRGGTREVMRGIAARGIGLR